MSLHWNELLVHTLFSQKVPVSTAINRLKNLTPNLLASGDDDGVIKVSVPTLTLVWRLIGLLGTTLVVGPEETRRNTGLYPSL